MDAISAARLTQIHPETARRVVKLLDQMEAEGYTVRVTRGISTVAQQNAIYAQGRDAQGHITDAKLVVTNAKGTESNHVLGYAADLAMMDPHGEPDWKSAGFDRLPAIASNFGLRSGAIWGDRPHVELSEVPMVPSGETQQTYIDGGVGAVWAELILPGPKAISA